MHMWNVPVRLRWQATSSFFEEVTIDNGRAQLKWYRRRWSIVPSILFLAYCSYCIVPSVLFLPHCSCHGVFALHLHIPNFPTKESNFINRIESNWHFVFDKLIESNKWDACSIRIESYRIESNRISVENIRFDSIVRLAISVIMFVG